MQGLDQRKDVDTCRRLRLHFGAQVLNPGQTQQGRLGDLVHHLYPNGPEVPDDILDDDPVLCPVLSAVEQLASEPGVRHRIRTPGDRPSDGHRAEPDAAQRSDQFGRGTDQKAVARELEQVQVRERIRAPEGREDGGRVRRFGEGDIERPGEHGLPHAADRMVWRIRSTLRRQRPRPTRSSKAVAGGTGPGAAPWRSSSASCSRVRVALRRRLSIAWSPGTFAAKRRVTVSQAPRSSVSTSYAGRTKRAPGKTSQKPGSGSAPARGSKAKPPCRRGPPRLAVQVLHPPLREQPCGAFPRPRDRVTLRRRRLNLAAVDLGHGPRVRDPVRSALPEAAHASRRRGQHGLGLDARQAECDAGEIARPSLPRGVRRVRRLLATGRHAGLHAALVATSRAMRCAIACSSAVSSGVAA